MNQKLIKCDECGFEFSLNAVGIHEAIVQLNCVPVVLVYFSCPKCNKIYRVSIKDRRYYELEKDLEKTKNRIRKNKNKAEIMHPMVLKKKQRLANYAEMVNKTFQGTFVFETSENNKIIKYLP